MIYNDFADFLKKDYILIVYFFLHRPILYRIES